MNEADGTGLVVAGVDGSPSSLTALRWAAADAQRRQSRLEVVIARAPAADWPHDSAEHVAELEGALQSRAQGVRDAAEQVLTEMGSPPADFTVTVGNAAFLLLDAAKQADVLVIGSRGRGGLRAALAGSTAPQLAGHTRCPLVVVRDLPAERHDVVVAGVDGATGSAVLEFAVSHAQRVGATVRAVSCWASTPFGGTDPDVDLAVDREPRYREVLHDELEPLRQRFPGVPIEAVVRYGRPPEVLAGEAQRADLLVVGSRGRGGFSTLILGSVALSVLHEVAGPVSIVPRKRLNG